jgi:hypothetical protein
MNTVRDLTGLTDEVIDQVLRWWAKQPRKIQLRCISIENMAELVREAAQTQAKLKEGQAKRYDRDLKSLEETEKVRLEQIQRQTKKSSPKARSIYNHRDLIVRLRNQGASWSDIATYLSKHTKLKLSASYLRRTWNGFQEKNII